MIVNADKAKKLSEPLARYLADNCPPSCAVIVRGGRAEVVEMLLTVQEYGSLERKRSKCLE